MLLEWESYRYFKHLKCLLDSCLLEKSFISYFGEIYEKDIIERLKKKYQFHVYHPDKEVKVKLHNNYYYKIQVLKISFLEKILTHFQIPIHSVSTYNTFHFLIQNFSLYYLFGCSFLATFSLYSFYQSPLFCYKKWNDQERRNFFHSLPLMEQDFLRGVQSILKDSEIRQLLIQIEKCQRNLKLVDLLEGLNISKVVKSYQKLSFLDRKKEEYYLRNKSKAIASIHYNDRQERQIYVSLFSMLNMVWHEMTHLLLGEQQFLVSMNGRLVDAVNVEGCFFVSTYRNISEVFSDYFSLQSFQTVKGDIERFWSGIDHGPSLYSNLFFLVEPFLKFFEYLMKYVSFYHLPKMLAEVIGFRNFLDYCALFDKFNLREEEKNYLLLKAQSIIHDMCEHVKNYEVNYYEMVNSYVEDLKSQGKRVRVLDEGMKKLKEEEDLIIYTKNSLK